jgi:predicted ATPase/DNA-binding SARP family transcriptional activator
MLAIHLLGRFEILLDDQPLPLPSRPAQSLLAYLLLHPGVAHRRERLAGLLWPDSGEENARNSLRHALWQLRQVIPDGYVQADRIAIAWDGGADDLLDVDRLERAADQAATADDLMAAASAYGGELLPGFYEDWVTLARERLRAVYAEGMQRLLENLVADRRWQEAVTWAERWLAHGETPEPAYRALMTAHAGLGDLATVAATYRRCVEVLETDLDAPPSAETTTLYTAIREGRLATDDKVKSSLHPFASSPHNLPAQTTPFVDRKAELAALADLLADPRQRLVTILAAGGMGKTRLALAAAEAQIERFPDGVFFVPLAALESPTALTPAIAEAVGYTFQNDPRSPQQQLFDYLRQRGLLLVLDNFEHLLDAADLVAGLLQAAAGVQLLVTSRERLQLSAETVLRLEGMDYPQAEADGEYSALDLFVQRARQVQPSFDPDGEELQAMARICGLVGGMPLAIVLAAAWVDVLSPRQIAAELEQNLELLETDLRDVPARQRSMAAVFEQTWQRLDEPERNLFMKLSVFRGGFTHEAATAVAGASLAALKGLVNKSLLQRTLSPRYETHELLWQYAAEQLDAVPGLAETTREHHCAYFAACLRQWKVSVQGNRRGETLRQMEAEFENARSAWQWATERSQAHRLDQMVEGLGHFYNARGQFTEGEANFRRAAEVLIAANAAPGTLIRIRIWQNRFLARLGHYQAFMCLSEESLALLDRSDLAIQDMRLERAEILMDLAAKLVGSERKTAREFFQQSLTLCREINNVQGMIRSLGGLAWIERHTGAYGEVRQLLEECLALCRAQSDDVSRTNILDLLGFTALEQGQFAAAERYFIESLSIRQREAAAPDIARGLRNWGVALTLFGRFAEGYARLAEAKAIYTDLDANSGLIFTMSWLGFAKLHLGEYARARVYGWEAVRLARSGGHQGSLANALLVLGSVYLAKSECAQLQPSFAECITIYSQLNQRTEWGTALATAAYAARASGEAEQARQLLAQALHVPTPEAFYPRAVALPLLALLLVDQGDLKAAAQATALASRIPYLANSRWFHDVAGRELAATITALPPQVVAAAAEQAQVLDPRAGAAELLETLLQKQRR